MGEKDKMIGKQFGKWIVLSFAGKNKDYRNYWLCWCNCEKQTIRKVYESSLLKGLSTNCGCVRENSIKTKLTKNLVGQKFGKLTVIEQAENIKTKTTWKCLCDCGGEITTKGAYLKESIIIDCGCENQILYKSSENVYKICNDYVVGYTTKGEEFYFDLEDFDKVKLYVWHVKYNYIVANHEGTIIRLHRLVMSAKDGDIVDHIKHEKNKTNSDNRKANLRFCEVHESMKNRTKFKNNTSGVTGVSFSKNRGQWTAYININQKRTYIGYFDTLEEAAKVRKEAEIKYYGEFRFIGDEENV